MKRAEACENCGGLSYYDPYFDGFKCHSCGYINRDTRPRGFEFVSNAPDYIKSISKLPTRATSGSAGYDFYCPCEVEIYAGEQEVIWTGVKAYMQPDEVLLIDIRSSQGIKNHLILANTIGVIDSDYYNNPDNEGEIGICLKNVGSLPVRIEAGERIAQGIFIKYLTANGDNISKERIGGIGSTD